jgi:hypothetical protein
MRRGFDRGRDTRRSITLPAGREYRGFLASEDLANSRSAGSRWEIAWLDEELGGAKE